MRTDARQDRPARGVKEQDEVPDAEEDSPPGSEGEESGAIMDGLGRGVVVLVESRYEPSSDGTLLHFEMGYLDI